MLPALVDAPDQVRADRAAMLLIRHFETALLDLFARGELSGTTHTCLGQEHVPVAVSGLLGPDDHVLSNHRGHGHYLARFDDPEGLLAEIMGRAGAVCHGVGGSQHIHRPGYLSTGVQGESLPVAAGLALHLRRHRPGALACVYIGDGSWGEGAVYEALNLAALWHLPLLVVVEHNGIAQSTPTGQAMAGTVAGRAAAFGLAHTRITGTDPAAIRAGLAPLVARVRAGEPLIAEFHVPRLGPHSKGDDTRPAEQVAALPDWYPALAAAAPELDRAQRDRVARVVADVSARPPAEWTDR
ncbi:thiamine pyrophosphate-dependent dehydrogenase E1 component subunit alpha [Dactylosporangium siamense]|uniref:Dehydrogenase n=1 Tax=Dactylosporangium siamense TaxID=685454 RepID=A0A919Q0N0_9ACTN|nr:thiamine pyrophosphate-dependent dehydrogenase E1 component subunit alpha [Dactylosporangium siamense]GIG52038.1 dehydrogenase [Dactylosporangium siamense]